VTLTFVVNGDDVLLLRRPMTSDRFPGLWNGIGGHVDVGECVRAAARREVREEAGIELEELSLRGVVHETGLVGAAHALFVFVARTDEREVYSPEGQELAWQAIEKLDALPIVHDVDVLLSRALSAKDPFFAVETYDGTDVATSVHMGSHA
jgi:8-oxo-dGTP diphosphatase